MKPAAVVTCVLAALALLAASPAGARSAPESKATTIPIALQLSFLLAQDPDFHLSFLVDPPGPDEVAVGSSEGAVVLAVLRGNPKKRVALTEYVARGIQTPERLRASFGKLGRVSMRFRESRRRPWFGKVRDCRGRDRFVVRRGTFVGNLRFRGEDGYLNIRAHRAKGAIPGVAAKCQRGNRSRLAHGSSIIDGSFSGLLATWRNGVNATVFAAASFRDDLVYVAQREESRGRLSVFRTAAAIGRGELPLNETVTGGRFSPPAPFHGTGRYRAEPDGSASWTGNLSVDFPGAPRFPLAGPGFETSLEAGF
ncbi:MAG TPA: hypothetical protein VNR67_08775 [Solirubrobacterales bacterium]|nr:hypothetical protein [Solirubrobacterales bacterium]